MSEQHFREIQLSGKQLVFLFMTSVVVAVGVFLLGVSVGRGVRGNTGDPIDALDQAAVLVPPAEMPQATELTADDTEYHSLQGTTTPPAEPEPVSDPVADEPAAAEVPAAAPEPRPQPAPTTTPTTAPPTTVPPAPATQKPAAVAADGWFLQIGAYRSRQNAERQVQELKAKGYAAAVAPTAAGGLFRVRVGPFAQRPEAERTQARLKSEEGTASSVTR